MTSFTIRRMRSDFFWVWFGAAELILIFKRNKKGNSTVTTGMPLLKRFMTIRHYRKCNRKTGCVTTRKQKQQQQRKQKQTRRRFRQRGGKLGLADFLPTTSWGGWSSPGAATQFSPTAQASPPLANGGMFTGSQSTGSWASTPFPPTQYAHALESAAGKGVLAPTIFAQQKPNDNFGASFSPAFATK